MASAVLDFIFVRMNVSMGHRLGTFFLALGLWSIGITLVGQTTWRRTYGGFDADDVRYVRQLDDGGFIALGSTGSFGISGDMYLLRLDPSGMVVWSAHYGGQNVQVGEVCHQVDGGFILAGSTSNGANGGYDMQLNSIDDDGELIWSRDIGSSDWDLCRDMKLIDGGFVLVGTTYGFGAVGGDAIVIRTDSQGDTLWTHLIGGAGLDEAMGVTVDSMGDIIVCGALDMNTEAQDAFVAKIDPLGDLVWLQRFGGDSADYISSIAEAGEGGYVGVGGTNSYSNVLQVFIRKIEDDGSLGWQREYGSGGDTRMREVIRTSTGEYAMIGYNSAFNAGGLDMFLIIVNWEGYFILGKNYGGLGDEEGYSLMENDDGGYILGGVSDHYGPGIRAGYVIRCGPDAETLDDTVYPFLDPLSIQQALPVPTTLEVFPNPSDGTFHLGVDQPVERVTVLDASGRVVYTPVLSPGERTVRTNLSSGTYFVEALLRDGTMRRARILIVRP